MVALGVCWPPYSNNKVCLTWRLNMMHAWPRIIVIWANPSTTANAARRELLDKLHTGEAAALLVTMDQPAAAMHAVTMARQSYPHLHIYARSRDEQHAHELHEAGATSVVPRNPGSRASTHGLCAAITGCSRTQHHRRARQRTRPTRELRPGSPGNGQTGVIHKVGPALGGQLVQHL